MTNNDTTPTNAGGGRVPPTSIARGTAIDGAPAAGPDPWDHPNVLLSFRTLAAVCGLIALLGVGMALWAYFTPLTRTHVEEVHSLKNLGDLGKAANTYKIDNKQWPAANGAAFWVVLYQNQYVSKLSMFIGPKTTDDNSRAVWRVGKHQPVPVVLPHEVSYAGPKDWRLLPRGAATDSLIGADDGEGPWEYEDGLPTVEVDGRAKFLEWQRIFLAAPRGACGGLVCRVGIHGRLVDLAN